MKAKLCPKLWGSLRMEQRLLEYGYVVMAATHALTAHL